MRYCDIPNDERLKVEFQRRLIELCDEIQRYQDTGHIGNIFALLFQVYSYLWSHDPYTVKMRGSK